MLATALVAGIFAYGFNYYTLSTAETAVLAQTRFAEAERLGGRENGHVWTGHVPGDFFFTPCGNAGLGWKTRQFPALAGQPRVVGVCAPFVIALHAAF